MTNPRSTLHAQRSTAFLAMVRVQTILISRYPANLAAGLLVSFGGVLALALATRMFTPATSGSTGEIAGVMFYGYLLYAFLSDSLWRIGYSVRQDQVQGTLEGLYLTPAPKFASLVSRAVPLFALTGIGAALALAAANWIFGGLPAAQPGTGRGRVFVLGRRDLRAGVLLCGLHVGRRRGRLLHGQLSSSSR